MTKQERFRGCLLGLAVGDAVGMVNEFKNPAKLTPVTDMLPGGPFNLPVGAFTDDTSMALCMADSFITCRGFNAHDQMNRYLRWYDEGYLSSIGRCFDCGATVGAALRKYRADPSQPFAGSVHPNSAGNGSLMRLAPAVMWCFNEGDAEPSVKSAYDSSMTTHASIECLAACEYFAYLLWVALRGGDKATVLECWPAWFSQLTRKVNYIAAGSYKHKEPPEIRGTGYVVDCLESALWAFHKTDNYRDCILAATNLGDDADTTSAVAGQLAGVFYGETGIPQEWRDKLIMREAIVAMADELLKLSEEVGSSKS